MPVITPTTTDVRWGPHAQQRYDHYKNPIRDAGGNPCLIYRHGGGWNASDKRQVATASVINEVAGYMLHGTRDVHFDVISIGTRQAAWNSAETTAGFGYSEGHTVPTYYPENFLDVKRAIVAIKGNSRTLGVDPNRLVLAGTSSGAVMAQWSQLTPPITAGAEGRFQGSSFVARSGAAFDSRVCGVWGHTPVLDFRKVGSTESLRPSFWYAIFGDQESNTQTMPLAIPAFARDEISPLAYLDNKATDWWVPTFLTNVAASSTPQGAGASYLNIPDAIDDNTVVKTDAFANYSFQAGDKIDLVSDGKHMILPIATKVNADAVTTTGQFSATALVGNVSFRVIYGKPYGTQPGGVGTARDPHDEEAAAEFIAKAQALGLDCGGVRYTTWNESVSKAVYTFAANCVSRGRTSKARDFAVGAV